MSELFVCFLSGMHFTHAFRGRVSECRGFGWLISLNLCAGFKELLLSLFRGWDGAFLAFRGAGGRFLAWGEEDSQWQLTAPPLPGSCWPDGWVIPTTLLGPCAPAAHGDLPFEPHLIEMKANRETLPPGYDTWKVEDSIDPSTRLSPRAPLSQKKKPKSQIPEFYHLWCLLPVLRWASQDPGVPRTAHLTSRTMKEKE